MMSLLKKEVLVANWKQMIQSTRSKQQDLVHLWDANGMYFMLIRNSLVAFPGGGFYVLHLFLEQLSAVGFQDVIGKMVPNMENFQHFYVIKFPIFTLQIHPLWQKILKCVPRQAKKKRKMSRRKSTVSTNSQWMSTKAFFSCGKDVSPWFLLSILK